jgi:hypothetical protein
MTGTTACTIIGPSSTHEKHGASGKEDTVLERRLLRMHARKGRQQ